MASGRHHVNQVISILMNNNGTKWGWSDAPKTQWHFCGISAKNAWPESDPDKIIRQKQTEEHFLKHLACYLKNKSRKARKHF